MAKISQGLLSQLANFGQDLTSPSARSGQGLAPAQQFGPSGLGGMFARNLGTTLGADMRTPNEKLTQGLSQIDPNDPQKMAKMYGLIVQFGDPPQKIAATQKLQELAQNQQNLDRVQRYRDSLIANANQAGLAELAPQIVNADETQLRELAKMINERQIKLIARGDDDKSTELLAQTAGIDPKDLQATFGDDLPQFDEMEKILAIGDKGSIKPFIGDDGKARMYSVLGTKVLINDKWQEASAAGLAPAPQQVQTQEIDAFFEGMPKEGKDLVIGSISSTIKDGQDADEILRTNAESQRLLDSGKLFTGLPSNALVTFEQIGSVFGFDASSAEATQQFTLQRFNRVADIIDAYGAGTGLSDADRDFAEKQAGVASLELGTLKRLLEIERIYATEAVTNRNNLIDYLTKNEFMSPVAAGVFKFTRKTPVTDIELSPTAQQYIQ
jgi:hypothetical protein